MGKNIKLHVGHTYERDDDLVAAINWHLERKDKQYPFNQGCILHRLTRERERLVIRNAQVSVESPIKPGDLFLCFEQVFTSESEEAIGAISSLFVLFIASLSHARSLQADIVDKLVLGLEDSLKKTGGFPERSLNQIHLINASAAIAKFFNRISATFLAGSLGIGVNWIANQCGELEPVILQASASEEAMANLARWEPAHGRFKFRNPWKQYLRVGASMRNCAYCIETLNGFITSEVQNCYLLLDSKWMILHSTGMGFAKEASQRSMHDANLARRVNAPVALRLLNKAGDMPSLKRLEDESIRTMVLQRACAFVTYTTREAAEKAADELSNKLVIKGLRLKLMWGRP
ncbi:zinc finger CCCH domain-containing protein 49-like protein [Tanacetum coccineum]